MKTSEIFDRVDQLRSDRKKIRDSLYRAEVLVDSYQNQIRDVNDEIENLATDLWGGAGPDCLAVQGGALHVTIYHNSNYNHITNLKERDET